MKHRLNNKLWKRLRTRAGRVIRSHLRFEQLENRLLLDATCPLDDDGNPMVNPLDCPSEFRSKAQTVNALQWWEDKTGNGLTADDTLQPDYYWKLFLYPFDARYRKVGEAQIGEVVIPNGGDTWAGGTCWTTRAADDGGHFFPAAVKWGCNPTVGLGIYPPAGRWLSTDSNESDNDYVSFNQPSIAGLVFEDKDGDGHQDDDEVGAPFVRVRLASDDQLCPATFCGYGDDHSSTDEAGSFLIRDVGPRGGVNFPLSIDPSYFTDFQTTPSPELLIRSGENVAGQKLGIFRQASVTGLIFNDLNGNGIQDSSESVRVGTPVFLDVNGDRIHNQGEPRTSSNAEGRYKLEQLGPGVVYAAPGTPAQLFSITTTTGSPYATESGVDLAAADMGVFRNVTFYGQVFDDKNGDGIRDHHDDPFLENVTVQLDLNDDGVVDRTAVTNSIGYYEFRYVGPGEHRLKPLLRDDQKLTMPANPDGYLIQTESGQSLDPLLFGLAEVAPLIVNSAKTRNDKMPGDEKCDTGEKVDGKAECTLWAAIQEANALAGRQQIGFAAPITAINVTTSLPEISGPVQFIPGTQRVVLLGNAAGNGLTISGGGSTIGGLTIAGFSQAGIELKTIGGNVIEDNELIGNGAQGIVIREGSTNNTIRRNRIGTDTNNADRGNEQAGIAVYSESNVIGGDSSDDGNLIAYNSSGIELHVGFNRVQNNVVVANRENGLWLIDGVNQVQGNYIGLDLEGRAMGNVLAGIQIDSNKNIIGGKEAKSGNVIAYNQRGIEVAVLGENTIDNNEIVGNLGEGIVLHSGSPKNTLLRNFIGIDRTGVKLGNGSAGIWVASSGNMIGGLEDGLGNEIAFNGADDQIVAAFPNVGYGIVVAPFPNEGTTTISGNAILRNSIHRNAGPGIDLGDDGTTANDNGSLRSPQVLPDTDAGPNGLQNTPELVALVFENETVGRLHSIPNSRFRLEFFANASTDVQTSSEGARFLGAIDATTDASGAATFTVPAYELGAGQVLTSTASRYVDGEGGWETSEFSLRPLRDDDTCGNTDLQKIKDGQWQVIQQRIDQIAAVDTEGAVHLRQLIQRTGRRQPDGCIPVTLERLDSLLELAIDHFQTVKDDGWWVDFADLLRSDQDRLSQVWSAAKAELGKLLTDESYFDQRILAFDEAMQGVLRGLRDEITAIRTDLDRDGSQILFDSIVLMGKDLRKVDTYTKLVSDALALELFAKVMDPNVPVEQRIGLYMLAAVQVVGALEGGGAVGKGLVETTRLKVLANRLSKSFAGESALAETLAVTMRKRIDDIAAGKKVLLKDLLDGEEVPIEIMDQLGWTPAQIDALRRISIDERIVMQFRTTNPKSAKFIRDGLAGTKPVDIKAKTINDLDVHLGFDSKHQGLVGLKDPQSLVSPNLTSPCKQNLEPLCTKIKERFTKHTNDWDGLISKLDGNKYRLDPDGRIIDTATNKPIAGDIDPVAFLDADGNNITGPAYDALVQRLKLSDALIQHGAETNIVDDVIKALKKACDAIPPSPKCLPEGSDKWHKEVQAAIDLKRDVLEPAHLNGQETTFAFGTDGRIRRSEVSSLPDVGSGEGEDAPFEPVPREQLIRLFADMNLDVRRDRLTTFNSIFAEIDERNDVKFELLIRRLRDTVPSVGIDESAYLAASPSELIDLIDSQPQGLHIDSTAVIDAIVNGAAEGEGGLTSQAIREKIRLVVGDSGMINYSVAPNDNGGFVVYSQTARQRPYDVNGDGRASPVDALIIINSLNEKGTQQLPAWPSLAELRTDVSLDGFRSPLDALLVINFLNAAALTPFSEAEGVAVNLAPLSLNSLQPMSSDNIAVNNSVTLQTDGETASSESGVTPLWARLVDTTVSANSRSLPARARELGLFEELDSILDDIVLGHAVSPLAGNLAI